MIDYNMDLLNFNDLVHSFFCLDREDPTIGFAYDASTVFGPIYTNSNIRVSAGLTDEEAVLKQRLILGSHLARHLRHELEEQKGYTSTVGIATNKVVSKLVGNMNKPKNQTTMAPPLELVGEFMDEHDIGKVPGIGFKMAQKIRQNILGRDPAFQDGLVYGGSRENVAVRDVRLHPGMGPNMLDDILSGPGSQKGVGGRIWALLNGVDDGEVGKAKRVPSQISQEDSYMKYLHTFEQVRQQLTLLSERLIHRMHVDLTAEDDPEMDEGERRRWLAHPRTLRLTTRPRPPLNSDGSRSRTFNRISRSAPMPNFVFTLHQSVESLAEKLVDETLVPMFRRLHPGSGWNLSLVNVAVTNMAETAAENKDSEGRDIGRMFRHQDDVLKDFRVTDEPQIQPPLDDADKHESASPGQADNAAAVQEAEWQSDDEAEPLSHEFWANVADYLT